MINALWFEESGLKERKKNRKKSRKKLKIFDCPQREKTIDFINKIKYFSFDIKTRDFDLMQLQGGIQTFGEKYGLSPREIYRLQICCEELIMDLLNHAYAPETAMVYLHLDVSYAEADRTTGIFLSCAGEAYNPFDQTDDGLGVTILKKMAKKIDYARENGMNRITISL